MWVSVLLRPLDFLGKREKEEDVSRTGLIDKKKSKFGH